MFDFIFSEVWQMETIFASFISAVAAFITAIFTTVFSFGKTAKEILKNLVEHITKYNTDNAALSKEHSEIIHQQKMFVDKQAEIQTTVNYLRDERLKENVRMECMSKKNLETQKALDVLNLSFKRMEEMEQELHFLKKENRNLKQHIKELEEQLEWENEEEEER